MIKNNSQIQVLEASRNSFVLNESGDFLYTNPDFKELLSKSVPGKETQNIFDVLPQSQIDFLKEVFSEHKEGELESVVFSGFDEDYYMESEDGLFCFRKIVTESDYNLNNLTTADILAEAEFEHVLEQEIYSQIQLLQSPAKGVFAHFHTWDKILQIDQQEGFQPVAKSKALESCFMDMGLADDQASSAIIDRENRMALEEAGCKNAECVLSYPLLNAGAWIGNVYFVSTKSCSEDVHYETKLDHIVHLLCNYHSSKVSELNYVLPSTNSERFLIDKNFTILRAFTSSSKNLEGKNFSKILKISEVLRLKSLIDDLFASSFTSEIRIAVKNISDKDCSIKLQVVGDDTIWIETDDRFSLVFEDLEVDYTEIFESEEKEKQRISNLIHEGLGQTVAALNMYMNGLNLDKSESTSQSLELIQKALAQTRMITKELSPNSLLYLGLKEAIEELVLSRNEVFGMKVDVDYDHTLFFTNEFVKRIVYRVCQELVGLSVSKRSYERQHDEQAKLVIKQLEAKTVKISYFDANVREKLERLDLMNLKNRVRVLGGNLKVGTADNMYINIEFKNY